MSVSTSYSARNYCSPYLQALILHKFTPSAASCWLTGLIPFFDVGPHVNPSKIQEGLVVFGLGILNSPFELEGVRKNQTFP